jgi:cytoskeletal protein CcmA (bactofilin family)
MRNRHQDDPTSDLQAETVVGASLNIEGDLKSKGNISIDGSIKGTVHTEGVVKVGAQAQVMANVTGKEVQVAGLVEGDIHADGRITLAGTARVKGNLSSSELVIEQGAHFTGASQMGEAKTVLAEQTATVVSEPAEAAVL